MNSQSQGVTRYQFSVWVDLYFLSYEGIALGYWVRGVALETIVVQLLIAYYDDVSLVVTDFSYLAQFFQYFLRMIVGLVSKPKFFDSMEQRYCIRFPRYLMALFKGYLM